MKIADSIFRAYDIRGQYPLEISESVAFKIGQAFAELIKAESGRSEVKILVSHDCRPNSARLKSPLIKGLASLGVNVWDAGLCATPTFYFGVARYGYDGGIQITASHLASSFAGFKLVRRGAVALSGQGGIDKLKISIEKDQFAIAAIPGRVKKHKNILKEEVAFVLNQVKIKKIKPLKVVVDAANAMAGPVFSALFKKLPAKLIKLNFKMDLVSPAHPADPSLDANNQALQEKVRQLGADLGLALDADADRLVLIDNLGRTVEPAIWRGLVAKFFLQDNPGAKICYDLRPGRVTKEMIEENGGQPIESSVGHSLIKEKMRASGAVLGVEATGHFIFQFDFGIFESPALVTLKLLEELSQTGMTLADYLKPYERYFHSGEKNFLINNPDRVFQILKEKYADHLVNETDGLSFEWPDWWFNLRRSQTELGEMRLNLEATSQKIMEEKLREVLDLIKCE